MKKKTRMKSHLESCVNSSNRMNIVRDKRRRDDQDLHKCNKLWVGCVVVVDRNFEIAVENENDCWYSVEIDEDHLDNIVVDDSEIVDDDDSSSMMMMMRQMVDEKDCLQ